VKSSGAPSGEPTDTLSRNSPPAARLTDSIPDTTPGVAVNGRARPGGFDHQQVVVHGLSVRRAELLSPVREDLPVSVFKSRSDTQTREISLSQTSLEHAARAPPGAEAAMTTSLIGRMRRLTEIPDPLLKAGMPVIAMAVCSDRSNGRMLIGAMAEIPSSAGSHGRGTRSCSASRGWTRG